MVGRAPIRQADKPVGHVCSPLFEGLSCRRESAKDAVLFLTNVDMGLAKKLVFYRFVISISATIISNSTSRLKEWGGYGLFLFG